MSAESITKHGVLIADPSPHMSSLIVGMLRSLDRRDVREVADARQAMIELDRRVFEVIIIDDELGGMDGLAFTRQLRADQSCQNRYTPVIMMSSAPDAKRIADARDAGVTEFLRKPFAANHLQTRLASIETNPREFVQAHDFNGPDRRRRTADFSGQERRRDDLIVVSSQALDPSA